VSNDWKAPTTWDEVCRRAGGRRHYNHWRQTVRLLRRLQVVRLLQQFPLRQRGTVAAIAKSLEVHPATVSRDIKALLREYGRCPHCGQLPLLGGDEFDVDSHLETLQAESRRGEWRWAGCGPLPRPPLDPTAAETPAPADGPG
jgi:hypothetical protein